MNEQRTNIAVRRRGIAPDLCAVVGLALLAYGAWRAWPPLGFIITGAGLLVAAVILAMGERRQE